MYVCIHCERISPTELLTCPYITSHIYFCVCVLGNIFQFCSSSKFQLHNPASSSIVAILFATSSDLIYLNNWKFVLFLPLPLASSACLPPPGNYFATICFYELSQIFFFYISHVNDTKQYFSLFSLNIMPSSFIHVVANEKISSF